MPAVFFDFSKADADKFDLDPSGMGLVSCNSDISSSARSDSLDNEFSCDSKMNIRMMHINNKFSHTNDMLYITLNLLLLDAFELDDFFPFWFTSTSSFVKSPSGNVAAIFSVTFMRVLDLANLRKYDFV